MCVRMMNTTWHHTRLSIERFRKDFHVKLSEGILLGAISKLNSNRHFNVSFFASFFFTDQIPLLTSAAPIRILTTSIHLPRPSVSCIITAPSTSSPPLNQIETFITRTEMAISSSHSRPSRNINGPRWFPSHRRPFQWTRSVSSASHHSANARITIQLTNLIWTKSNTIAGSRIRLCSRRAADETPASARLSRADPQNPTPIHSWNVFRWFLLAFSCGVVQPDDGNPKLFLVSQSATEAKTEKFRIMNAEVLSVISCTDEHHHQARFIARVSIYSLPEHTSDLVRRSLDSRSWIPI